MEKVYENDHGMVLKASSFYIIVSHGGRIFSSVPVNGGMDCVNSHGEITTWDRRGNAIATLNWLCMDPSEFFGLVDAYEIANPECTRLDCIVNTLGEHRFDLARMLDPDEWNPDGVWEWIRYNWYSHL